jgi:hypothetical protein
MQRGNRRRAARAAMTEDELAALEELRALMREADG